MVTLLLTEVLASVEHTMVINILPSMVREFHDLRSVTWAMTAFLLCQAATAAVGGRIGDMIGRKRMLVILVLVCGLGSLVSALSSSLEGIIVGRAIQGCSGAILPLCYGVTREEARAKDVPVLIGILTGGYAFAAVFGYLIGGHFSDQGHWRSVFMFAVIFSLLLLPLIMFVLPSRPGTGIHGSFDVLGALLFAPAIASVLYGITAVAKVGWAIGTAAWFIGGVLALVVWTWHELRAKEPLINVRLLARREVAVGNLCGALASFGVMQLPIVSIMILQQPAIAGVGIGLTATMAGLFKLPSNFVALVASPLSGVVAGRYGPLLAVLQGGAVCVIGWVGMAFMHDTLVEVVFFTIVCGFGAQMLLAAVPNTVLNGVPIERSSEVTGLTSVIRATASAAGAQTIAILLATSRVVDPRSGVDYPSNDAYQLTFIWIAGTALIISAVAFWARRPKPPAAVVSAPEPAE
jgi:MFS family permease